ncbi:N-6 DNA methylase [Brevibacillus sp. SYSU BS000544]|uniref:class I SAM-dependent DNA methyltransferase n=1 Tax=Brevibacillus sp. SYSU BS000544 TaxID=3416443 RepID=UPI003CE5B186
MKTQELVQKLWNLCHVLRDDGITYHQYVVELTYLLFIKLLRETGQEHILPVAFRWDRLTELKGEKLLETYSHLLTQLGATRTGLIGEIYAGARTHIAEPRNLEKIIQAMNEGNWYSSSVEGLGDLYEGLLAKNASEKKSGAGQYFTPRPLVTLLVELMNPQVGDRCNDPACGTFGFMIAAERHVRALSNNYRKLSEEERLFQHQSAFSGCELVQDTHRLALMNAMLHGLESQIILGDTLAVRRESQMNMDVILTNPPFGSKKGGERPARPDLPFVTSNKQLAFIQHIYSALRPNGSARAAVIVPDNVLFQDNEAQKIRCDLMEKCNLHTVLRLPTGIFYATGVHTSVLFFTRGTSDEANTQGVWFYDLRSDMPNFGKRVQLTEQYFTDFIEAYRANDRHAIADQRWSYYSREQIRQQGDNLDLGLLHRQALENNSDPVRLAENAIGKLEEASRLLQELLEDLKTRRDEG